MSNESKSMGDLFPDLGPEDPVVSGIAHDRTEAQVTLRRMPDRPGVCASVFTSLAEAGVNVDMIVQAAASTGTADISFTASESELHRIEQVLDEKREELAYETVDMNKEVGKVALVGVGMKTHSGIAATFFRALSEKGINVLMISTSEIRISAMVPLNDLNNAVRAIHTAFNLDSDQVEAVVYGGTGR
ncbi:aspartate kinase [Bifidobacterium margollesii]|uniref:aspartate kinase n=1 Tax=Bifidobacterium margollesii TaxID=2020964 RepID=A0A2N5JC50_9BIFI|nr:ACT domain-containing protein [Bifidobacterium margollesii]PLS31778.1 aspartate kinase [Bifidobacterium margollesii]